MQVRRYTTSELTLRFWAAFALLLTFSAIFVAYVYAEKRIDVANDQRVYSLKVIGELRQSSDDFFGIFSYQRFSACKSDLIDTLRYK